MIVTREFFRIFLCENQMTILNFRWQCIIIRNFSAIIKIQMLKVKLTHVVFKRKKNEFFFCLLRLEMSTFSRYQHTISFDVYWWMCGIERNQIVHPTLTLTKRKRKCETFACQLIKMNVFQNKMWFITQQDYAVIFFLLCDPTHNNTTNIT